MNTIMELSDDESSTQIKIEQGRLSLASYEGDIKSDTCAEADTEVFEENTIGVHSEMIAKFEVVLARIVSSAGQKSYVSYSFKVQKTGTTVDVNPAFIERRYTDFSVLYHSLKKEFPALTSNINFPKKLLLGNFTNGAIEWRSTGFESLLKFILENERLRESDIFKLFLCEREIKEAKKLMVSKSYALARPILEKSFNLLSKIYTDRHTSVLLTLCCLTACCNADPTALDAAEKYAMLALQRYEGVCDIDLLQYYVPLLQLCFHLWWSLGRDNKILEKRLDDLRRCGHKVEGCPSLLDAMLGIN